MTRAANSVSAVLGLAMCSLGLMGCNTSSQSTSGLMAQEEAQCRAASNYGQCVEAYRYYSAQRAHAGRDDARFWQRFSAQPSVVLVRP
jgi:outer membrane lipoprotein SlyB